MKTEIAAMSTAPVGFPSRRPRWWRLGVGALLGAALLVGGLGAGANPVAADDLAPSPPAPVPAPCQTILVLTEDGTIKETTVCVEPGVPLNDITDQICKRMPRLTICQSKN
jgi:hypothetical protein